MESLELIWTGSASTVSFRNISGSSFIRPDSSFRSLQRISAAGRIFIIFLLWTVQPGGTGGVPDSFCEDERLSDGSQCGVPGSVCLSDGCLAEKRGFGTEICMGISLLFLLAGPMIYQSCHQIMFVQYMPFLILALLGIDRYWERERRACIHWACF